ncbi:MAG: pectate lyase-like adhesive domain-containing protein [Kurthia gibsonii]
MKTSKIISSFLISLFFLSSTMYVQAEEKTDVKSEVTTKEPQTSSTSTTSTKLQKQATDEPTEATPTEGTENVDEPEVDLAATDTVEVSTPEELKTAVATTTVTTVKLKNDINLGSGSYPVNHSVLIDGQNHTITYGENRSTIGGLYFSVNDITIHYKNINFGYKSELGKNSEKNADNYYGFTPGYDRSNVTLISENLNYYSDYGAQPFHMRGVGSKLIFAGTNEFIMQDSSGYAQEFAEATYLEFLKDSSTTVRDTNARYSIGFIWAANANLNFIVGENAKVDMKTQKDFMYIDPSVGNISLGKNSEFDVEITEPHQRLGRLIYQNGRTLNLEVGQGAKINSKTINPTVLGTLTANFGADSISRFSAGTTDVFSTSTGVLNLNNSREVSFHVDSSPGTTTGAIGISGTNSKINFSDNSPTYGGYQTFLNNSQTPIVTQPAAGSWILNGGFSRTPTDFTSDQKTAMKTAQTFKILRNRPINTSFSATETVKTKTVNLEKYAAIKKGNETIDFYWQDPDAGDTLMFKVYDAQNNEVATTGKITTTGQAGKVLQQMTIPTTNLAYGENKYTIKVFDVSEDGSLLENSTSSLNLILNVDGALYFETITPTFSWTNRKILDTKGILNRDVGNNLSMNIVDSRQNPTNWTVTATLQNQTQNPPFTFVWKANETATPTAITGQSILTNTDVTTVEQYLYNKTWNEKTAVLLKSDDYIKPGSYNNQSIINWTLNSVPDTP